MRTVSAILAILAVRTVLLLWSITTTTTREGCAAFPVVSQSSTSVASRLNSASSSLEEQSVSSESPEQHAATKPPLRWNPLPSSSSSHTSFEDDLGRPRQPRRHSRGRQRRPPIEYGIPALPIHVPKLSELMTKYCSKDLENVQTHRHRLPHDCKRLDEDNKNENSSVDSKVSDVVDQARRTTQKSNRDEPRPNTGYCTHTVSSKLTTLTTGEPWRAPYVTSVQTQSRIKAAAITSGWHSKIRAATAVLNTLLRTPFECYNVSNLICALTLSAKLASSSVNVKSSYSAKHCTQQRQERAEFRRALFSVLNILHGLLMTSDDNHHDGKKERRRMIVLNARQLCNAAWAIGKHCTADPMILPSSTMTTTVARGGNGREILITSSEQWNFDSRLIMTEVTENHNINNNNNSNRRTVWEIMNELALRLTQMITSTKNSECNQQQQRQQQRAKPGELVMASWAYAVIHPRTCPPGWELPRRIAREIQGPMRGNDNDAVTNVVNFEKWEDYSAVSRSNLEQQTRREQHDNGNRSRGKKAGEKYAANSKSVSTRQHNMTHVGTDNSAIKTPTMGKSMSSDDVIIDQLFDAIAFALGRTTTPFTATDVVDVNGEEEETTTFAVLTQCSWKELSNIAWAYASRGRCLSKLSERLMIALTREAARRLDGAADVVSSFEKKKDTVTNNSFIPRDLSVIAWAIGILQSDNFRLSESLIRFIDSLSRCYNDGNNDDSHGVLNSDNNRPLRGWKSADLVQLAVALSHSRIENIVLLSAIYREAMLSLTAETSHVPWLSPDNVVSNSDNMSNQSFHSWELTVLLWVQARLYLTSKQDSIFADFSNLVPKVLRQRMMMHADNMGEPNNTAEDTIPGKLFEKIGLGSQEQANLVWSLTVLEQYHTKEAIELFCDVFRSASCSYAEGKKPMQLEHGHQLWQALFLFETNCPGLEEVVMLSRDFRSFLQDRWILEKSRIKTSSARHRSLSQTLDFMGVAHTNEHDEDIDVAIVLKEPSSWTHTAQKMILKHEEACSHKVAVEFDGPNHFTRETPGFKQRALGHTVLKYRMLKSQGWTVIRVPYFEFDKIPFWASMERQRYLQRLLKTHANIRFSDVDVSQYRAIVPNRKSRFD